MNKKDKLRLKTLLFVSENDKVKSFPNREMNLIYCKIEKEKLVDVNLHSSDWWLTYEGERELKLLISKTFFRKILRFLKWFISVFFSGIILYCVGRIIDSLISR